MSEKLSTAELSLLTAMLAGANIPRAASAVGMVERTARRWAARPHFQAELQRRTSEALATSARQLAAVMGAAVATTAAIMVDDTQPGAVRLAAARTILSERARLVDEIDIMARLGDLEKILDEQGH
jgi:hypothetical protein